MTAAVSQAASLTAYAELPADTFTPGPTSGQQIDAANGRQPPFINQQPVQGFSALIKGDDDTFYVLSDNGFGKRANSADYLLAIYHLKVDFQTAGSGNGSIHLLETTNLKDTAQLMPYPITRKQDRLLTGEDLDPESFQKTTDGSYWVGEEFIPALLHFDASGNLLAKPFTLNGLASPDNSMEETATIGRSKGFEGMAISKDGRWLYPMLEGDLTGSEPGLGIYTFDIEKQQFLNPRADQPSYRYRLDKNATAIGDFTLFSDSAGLVLERDSGQGPDAVLKRVYRVDFKQIDAEGYLSKTLVADLLNIEDPHDLNRDGSTSFSFPFWTIEGLVVINRTTLGIVNDNNYPFGAARGENIGHPDNNEFIQIEVDPLWD